MELVNGAKAEWKPEKENCTVYSFPGVAAYGEPGCGSQREQMIKVADSSLYQREPCYSFGLKCWFKTEKVQERELVLRFIWWAILHRFTDFQSTLPVFAERSHHPPLHREGRFAVYSSWYFIAENKIKQSVYSISQSATLTALFTKESLAFHSV